MGYIDKNETFEEKLKRKKRKKIAIFVLIALLIFVPITINLYEHFTDDIGDKKAVNVTLEIKSNEKNILDKTKYEMKQGDTAFDLIKKATSEKDIQIEYYYTKSYDTYFVKGIDNLYAGDKGSMSGWMYAVNKKTPEYGCSKYILKSGDDVLFVYTLNGGKDIVFN